MSSEEVLNNLLLSVVLSVVFYLVPTIIYRFSIVKRALDDRKAKKMSIIFGIIALAIQYGAFSMMGKQVSVNAAGIFVWYLICKKIMASGFYRRYKPDEDSQEEENEK